MGRVRKTLWHTAVYGAGIILNRALAFILLPIYTRVLAESDIGLWDLCTTTVLFLTPVLELGMGPALLRFYHGESKREGAAAIRNSVTFVGLVLLVFLILAWGHAEKLSAAILLDPREARLIHLVMILGALTVLLNQPLAILRAREQSAAYAVLNLLRAGFGGTAILYLVLVRQSGVEGILLGEIVGLTAACLTGWAINARYIRPTIDIPLLKRMLGYGLPLVPLSVASITITLSDRFFLASMIGKENMAVYTVGFKVAMIISVLSRAFQTAWPVSAFQIAKDPDAGPTFAQLFRLTSLGMTSAAVVVCALAPELVAFFAPSETYAEAVAIVPWIAFSFVLYAISFYTLTCLLIVHKTAYQLVAFLGGAACKLGLNWLLIRGVMQLYGPGHECLGACVGAAAATFISFLVQFLIGYALSQRFYPVPYDLKKLALLAGFTALVAAGFFWSYDMPSMACMGLRGGLVLSFVCIVNLAGFITPQEKRNLYSGIKGRVVSRFKR